VRELTHVADVAEAYRLALAAARPGDHALYNVGSGIGVTISEVVAMVEQVTGRAVRVEHRPAASEPPVLLLDSQQLRRALGWRPQQSSLQQLIQDGWSWLDTQGSRSR
jgi:UDP-glucose 4-epimerase